MTKKRAHTAYQNFKPDKVCELKISQLSTVLSSSTFSVSMAIVPLTRMLSIKRQHWRVCYRPLLSMSNWTYKCWQHRYRPSCWPKDMVKWLVDLPLYQYTYGNNRRVSSRITAQYGSASAKPTWKYNSDIKEGWTSRPWDTHGWGRPKQWTHLEILPGGTASLHVGLGGAFFWGSNVYAKSNSTLDLESTERKPWGGKDGGQRGQETDQPGDLRSCQVKLVWHCRAWRVEISPTIKGDPCDQSSRRIRNDQNYNQHTNLDTPVIKGEH